MNKILVVVSFVFVSFLSCTGLTDRQRLANQILSDTNLLKVDSMARATIRNGFNAGSGYSQIWARDMNTFIEIACEESDPHELREAILLFFALQQPNDEMIDGYVLKGDFTWYDDTPYYSNAAPKHVAFKNTVETDQESSLIQIVGKYIRKTGDREILNEKVAGKTVLERMNAMVDYLMRERYNEKYGLLYGAMTADWGDVQPNDDFGCDMNDLSDPAIDVLVVAKFKMLNQINFDIIMKRVYYLLSIGLLSAIGLTSCGEDEIVNENTGGGDNAAGELADYTLTASIRQSEALGRANIQEGVYAWNSEG